MLPRSFVVAAAICCAISAHAQSTEAPASPPKPPERKTVVTFNPLAVFAAYVTVDAERAISPAVSLGASGSITASNDFNNYGALEGKVRYYPNEKVLQGFSVAAALGIATARENVGVFYDSFGNLITVGSTSNGIRVTRGTIGMDLSYQWLLGPKRRFVTVIGAGAKRFFGSETYVDPFSAPVIPTARVNIGFAF